MNYKRKSSFVSYLVVIIFLFISLFFINPKNIFAESENLILRSLFLKDDPTAKMIISGQIINYDIRTLSYFAPFDTTTFAYRFISALRMLGYTGNFNIGNKAVTLLNIFEKNNGFVQSPFITKQILITLDNQLALIESKDSELIKIFPIYKYYSIAPLNEPTKEHVVALYSNIFKKLPTHLVIWSEKEFLYFLMFELPNYIKSEVITDDKTICDLTIWKQMGDRCKIQSNQVYGYSDDFSATTLIIHEYAHYLDNNLSSKTPGTSKGIIDTNDFFSISYDISDVKINNDNWKFYTLKRPNNINNEFLSTYAQGWQLTFDSSYRTAFEDFAESFAMYVTQGKVFRILADKNTVLKQKYDWLKQNVFKGTEYLTGVDNAIMLIKNNPYHTIQPTVTTGVYNIEEFSEAVPGFVWNYNFDTLPTGILSINPSSTTIYSGDKVTLSYTTHSNALSKKLYLSCPTGIKAMWGIIKDICNTWLTLDNKSTSIDLIVTNLTSITKNIVPNFYEYLPENPNFAQGVSTQITVRSISQPQNATSSTNLTISIWQAVSEWFKLK